ncbi:MAG TPA: hypothetical protein VGH74_15645 [Planctomycetaceae bacterium]
MITSLACCLLLISSTFAADPAPKPAANWRYVAESGEPGFDRPPLQKLPLANELPDNVAENVNYAGSKRKYALVRYGTPNSTRVTVVVDERADGEFDLYVDRNRNRIIEAKDLVAGSGPLRTTALAAEIVRDDVAEYLPRQVVFRRSPTTGALSFASTGFLTGQIDLAGRQVAVRRVDGDGNGFFADSRDRLWIDIDGNGVWDQFTEQFPLAPMLKIDDQRYAVRSDAIGSRLMLEAITGVGTIKLKLGTLPPGTNVSEIELMLAGEDGSAFTVRGADEGVQVPVGRYAAGSLSISMEHPGESLPWNFVFSRQDSPDERHWHAVAKDALVEIDPIGKLNFTFEFPNGNDNLRPGKNLSVAPRLLTHEGLLINSCGIGRDDGRSGHGLGPSAEIRLISASGAPLASTRSGFA